jgi:predicted nucleotidyltransferase component of viral defense system
MIKPGEIQKIANRLGIRDTQIEKDYVIGWILKGISEINILRNKLLFKGGTALRKIYFPEYRLSEDLDFTYYGDDYKVEDIRDKIKELIGWTKKEVRISLDIQDEKEYQTGNYNFYMNYTGPLRGVGANKSIKVDIANDEKLCNDPIEKIVHNEYSDLNEEFKISSYTLEEIIAEKMRSLIQRTMPRDIYDIWYMFEVENLDIEDFIFNFQEKTEFKQLDPKKFTQTVLAKEATFKGQWETSLHQQIKDIPDFDQVWRSLGKHWKKYNKFINS